MSKEWDDADARCKEIFGDGHCAVAGPDVRPTNPLHCVLAMKGKQGDIKVVIQKATAKKIKPKSPGKK